MHLECCYSTHIHPKGPEAAANIPGGVNLSRPVADAADLAFDRSSQLVEVDRSRSLCKDANGEVFIRILEIPPSGNPDWSSTCNAVQASQTIAVRKHRNEFGALDVTRGFARGGLRWCPGRLPRN